MKFDALLLDELFFLESSTLDFLAIERSSSLVFFIVSGSFDVDNIDSSEYCFFTV
jgi:hypothetical protein